jgi:hypothetical protein
MTTQYTTILKLALPVQGELSGTWGDVVNNNITQMVEQAVAGKAVINTWTGNSHTLTTADGTTSESRCAILELTDSGTALTGAGTVVCPTNTKLYIVDNNTAEIITVQTAAGTGVAVPVGKTMLVYCDGTNVVEGVTHANSLSLGTSTNTVNAISIATDLGAGSSSHSNLPTQLAVKTYVDGQIAATNELSEVLAAGNVTGANDIDVDSAQKVQFRDAAIYINSSVDGQLDIVADGEVQIDTALVDINGNLDVSGTTNISGSVSFTKNAIAGVAISTTSRSSNTVTVTTSAVHGLTSGDLVNVNGVADTSFNGYFTVSVSSTTVFTYSQTGADGSSTGGTSTEVVYNLNASGTALNWMNGPLNIAANSGIDGLEITQSGAGNGLHVTGTTGLVGNTTLTGNLDVSGTTLVTGVLTTTAATVFNGGFASNADSTLGTDKKVQFRDSAIYINSSVDGQLDIVADTEIQIAATTVDLNGNLDVSGTALVTGVLTTTAATVFNGGFASNAASTISLADNTTQLTLISTDADSAVGPVLDLFRNSASPGNFDLLGKVLFSGEDDGGNKTEYAHLQAYPQTVTGGAESGYFEIHTLVGGTDRVRLEANATEVAVNNPGIDSDFRVESSGNANMLFVDGENDRVGIGTSSPDATGLHVYTGSAGSLTPNAAADDLVVESNGNAGITIASPDANYSGIIFSSPTDTTGSIIEYNQSGATFDIGTSTSGGVLRLRSGNFSETMRLDASGNVGIGTSSPSEKLHVSGGNALIDITSSVGSELTFKNYGVNQFSADKNYHEINFITSDVSSETTGGYVRIKAGQEVSGNDNRSYLGFWTAPNGGAVAERMRIDSSGNVGIGTSSPDYTLDLGGATPVIRIGDAGSIQPTLTRNNSTGGLTYNTTGQSITSLIEFKDNGAERMRIDASGNLLVGTTDSTVFNNSTGSGVVLNENGQFQVASTSTPSFFNRQGTDGTIIDCRKDGATVGSIGYNSGNGFYMHTPFGNDSGLVFGSERIVPCTSTGAFDDAVVDLGYESGRFKDLYLSEGISLSADDGGGVGTNTIGFKHTINTAGYAAAIEASYSADFRANLIFKINTSQSNIAPIEVGRFSNSGNLGIGSSLPSEKVTLAQSVPSTYTAGLSTLANPAGTHVRIENNSSVTDTFVGVTFVPTNGAAQQQLAYMGAVSTGSGLAPDIVFGRRAASTYYVESMRIDASGNLLVGSTDADAGISGTPTNPPRFSFKVGNGEGIRSSTTGSHYWNTLNDSSVHNFRRNGADVGSISVSTGATAYNTSSDQRLKENIADADDAGSKIDAIQVRKFDWKVDGSHQDYGMVAQELQAVAPEAVHQPADSEEMMGVDYSKLVPMMLKEIQSLRARVSELES